MAGIASMPGRTITLLSKDGEGQVAARGNNTTGRPPLSRPHQCRGGKVSIGGRPVLCSLYGQQRFVFCDGGHSRLTRVSLGGVCELYHRLSLTKEIGFREREVT